MDRQSNKDVGLFELGFINNESRVGYFFPKIHQVITACEKYDLDPETVLELIANQPVGTDTVIIDVVKYKQHLESLETLPTKEPE